MTWFKKQQKSNTDINSGFYLDIESGALWKIGGVTVTPTAAQINKLTTMASTAAAIDAAVSGEILVYRANITAALVHAAATAIVPAVAGQRFQVLSIAMRSNGGAAITATTVGVKEDGGAIFLSQATAGLTAAVWHNLVTGTPVITGMTAGGMTAVANKALLAYDAGGILAGTVTMDFIVAGYYTTT